MAADPTTTALVAVAYLAAHGVGDYWAQTDHQAANKSGPGWAGRRACAAHVATLTAAHAAALALVLAATATSVHPVSAALGLTITAVTHYWADRRWTLAALVGRVTRTHEFRERGGMAHLDQSWHTWWIVPAALATAAPPAGAALVATTSALVLAVCHATAVRASPPPHH